MPVSDSFYLGAQANQQHVDQAVAEIMHPDEFLLAAFHGQALSGEGYGATAKTKGGFSLHDYLLVTDQRVIFWARGVFKRSTDGFHYDDIASVEEATGLIAGEIVLNVRGAKKRMRSMVKTDVPVAARMIRDLIGKAKAARPYPFAAPPMAQPHVIYLLGDNGAQDGPYDVAQVQQKLASGEVQAGTLVWHDGLSDWSPLSQVIRAPSKPPPPPSPPPPPVPLPVVPPAALEPPPPYSVASAPTEQPASTLPVILGPPPSEPPPPRPPWFKRKGWQIAFFIVFPYFQVPLMWYWRLFSKRTRIWMTVAGCFWSLCVLGQREADQQHYEAQSHQAMTSAATPTGGTTSTGTAKEVSGRKEPSVQEFNNELSQLDPSVGFFAKVQQAMSVSEKRRMANEMVRIQISSKNFQYTSGWIVGYDVGSEVYNGHPLTAALEYYNSNVSVAAKSLFADQAQQQDFLHGYQDGYRSGSGDSGPSENASSMPAPDWARLTKAEWRDKAVHAFSWMTMTPLSAPAARFQQIMGKPNRTQTFLNEVFWYYKCSDGTIQMEMDASVLQTTGTIQAQVEDY